MTREERELALQQLGDQTVGLATNVVPNAWNATKQRLRDPVALDRFVLQCHTAADGLMILAQRASEHAGDLLDGDD